MNDENENQQPEQQTTEPQAPLPGERLRQAREAAGLTQVEVATEMRINERMVAALEEDDYDSFPSAAFVSGYLRSYARILGLSEEEFVQPVKDSIAPPSIVSTIGEKEQASSRDLPVRLVTYLLVLAVIVSVGMWWFSQGERRADSPEPEIHDEMVGASGGMELSPTQGQEAKVEPEPVQTTGQEETAVDEAPAEDEARGSPPVREQISEEEEADRQESEAQMEQPPATETEQEEGTPAPLTEETPKSLLVLKYTEDSWTEITDSAGRRLAYGLIKAGQTLKLEGEAPFQVSLGYAPGVEVFYNGELFDHTPFRRRDLARFRVGRSEHNLPGSR